jgi:hypothetical protein
MFDHFTHDNVDVRSDRECGPYIMIEPASIARVQELLERNGIPFHVEDRDDACKDGPEAAVIEFGKGADVQRIQRVLDSVN